MAHDPGVLRRSTLVILLAALVVVPALAAEAAEPGAATMLAQYVLVADSAIESCAVSLARVVLAQPAAACPTIVFSDGSPALAMVPRRNPNPAALGVAVCEAVVSVGAGVTARVEGQTAPLPVLSPGSTRLARLAVLGDSGCKAPKQDCTTAWPLPKIAAAAAAGKPELVIHVGDYNYRGTPNKTQGGEWSYDGCVPEDWGPLVHQSSFDTWETWNDDFFVPMAPLLAAAPWVVVRGNHELCSRAGRGWFYFLDPHSPLLDPYDTPPSCDAPAALTPPFRLGFANLELVVLDSANACGGEDPESHGGTAYETQKYTLQFAAVATLLSKSEKPNWLLTHRPIWSLGQWTGSPPSSENQTLQPALAASPLGALPKSVGLVLSGHMHQFFSLSFLEGERPQQLVVGNSGVVLGVNALPSPWTGEVDGVAAAGLSIADGPSYGYLGVELTDAAHWSGTVFAFDATGNPQAAPLALCAQPLRDGRLCAAGK